MMRILGIDPGETTTGWCIYDAAAKRVVAAGQFCGDTTSGMPPIHCGAVVLERPKGQGPTFPQVVEAGIVFGSLRRWCQLKWPRVAELYRYDVKRILTDATLGEVRCVNDKTVWEALKLLHGGAAAARKSTKTNPDGGPIGGVVSHERAALAVAVAWSLIQERNE